MVSIFKSTELKNKTTKTSKLVMLFSGFIMGGVELMSLKRFEPINELAKSDLHYQYGFSYRLLKPILAIITILFWCRNAFTKYLGGDTGIRTQDMALVLYHIRPFCFSLFFRYDLMLFLKLASDCDPPISASQVAGIISIAPPCLALHSHFG
jgi:hypothetical protein